jgi:hypothetical protein
MPETQCEAHRLRINTLEKVINGNGSNGMKANLASTITEVHGMQEDIAEIKTTLNKLLYGVIGLGASFILNVGATLIAAFVLSHN